MVSLPDQDVETRRCTGTSTQRRSTVWVEVQAKHQVNLFEYKTLSYFFLLEPGITYLLKTFHETSLLNGPLCLQMIGPHGFGTLFPLLDALLS